MSAEGVKKFIAVVELHFPRPQYDGDETRQTAWVASIAGTIGGYSDEVLNAASHKILRDRVPKRDGRFFPVPSECEEVCKSVAKTLQAEKTPLLADMRKQMPYGARCDLARDLMQSPLGKQARREGWGEAMFYFCVQHAKAPIGKEIDECKKTSKAFADEHERCLRGDREHGRSLAAWAESIRNNARKLMEKSA